MKDIYFHLPNEGLEDLECFALVFFYAHINMAFCFYIYVPLQVVSCDQCYCFDPVEIALTQIIKIVYHVVHYHTFWCLIDLGD